MNIEGALLTPKKVVGDDRGQVMHVLRSDDANFVKFGEVYVSAIFSGVTKGWKLHTLSTSNMVVLSGNIRFVLFDAREGSQTQGKYDDVVIGASNYQMLTVPPGVVYAWLNTEKETALILNCATELWSPNESSNLPIETYHYAWE